MCVLFVVLGGYAMALPAPRVRIDRDGYDIESPHAKVQFVLGHKSLSAFIQDTHQKMAKREFVNLSQL